MKKPMISINDLNVLFGLGNNAIHAVRDASFKVGEGESYVSLVNQVQVNQQFSAH